MSKLITYLELLPRLKLLNITPSAISSIDARGNFAFWIDKLFDTPEWNKKCDKFVYAVFENNVNEACWVLYNDLKEIVKENFPETESIIAMKLNKLIDAGEELMKRLYKENSLETFITVPGIWYPDWFIEYEKNIALGNKCL